MKKAISFLLSLIFLGSLFVTDVAAKSNNREFNEAFEVLSRLGIIDVSNISDFEADDIVSRAQFSEYVASALKLDTKQKKVYFSDVGLNHASVGAIAAMVDNGIIGGYGDGCFYPEKAISSTEAYKMIVCALGYGNLAEAMGGYPNGYIKAAEQINIVSSSVDVELKKKEAIVILHNACMTNRLMPYSLRGETTAFNTADNSNVYYTLYDVDYAEGIVTGAGGVDLNDESHRIRSGLFILNNDEYFFGSDTYSYLGNYVHVFYYPDTKSVENTVLYIELPENKNNTMTITSEMFDSFDGSSIKYFSDANFSRIRRINIAKDAIFCYNRSIFSKSVSTVFDDFSEGQIILKDSNFDDSYDVIIIKSYKNIVVSMVDYSNSVIYNKLNTDTKITLEDYQSVLIKDTNEKEIEVGKIGENAVLSVAESKDGTNIEVIVCYERISGKLEAIEEENNLYITIDGVRSICDDSYKNDIKNMINIGMTYTFYCDAFGKIVYVADTVSQDMSFGYLVSGYFKKDIPTLKIYTEQAELIKIVCGERVRVDGVRIKNLANLIPAIPGTTMDAEGKYVVAPQLIRYKLDGNGQIVQIDTINVGASENKENSLTITDSGNMFFDHISRLGMKTIIGSATKVFKVPSDGTITDPKFFTINKSFSPYVKYDAISYSVNQKNGYADAIVIKTSSVSNIDKESHICMIAKTETYYSTEEEEIKTKLTYYSTGNKYEKYINDEAYLENPSLANLVPGDLCVFGTNAADEINDVYVFYDYNTYKGEKPITWSGYDSETGRCWYKPDQGTKSNIIFGYVNEKNGNIIQIGYSKKKEHDESHLTNGTVVIYDSSLRKNNVYTIPVSEIRDYASVGSNCDTMIVHTIDYRTYNGFYVYR